MLNFIILLYWTIVYFVLGFIVLACVPQLRVTLLNLLAFVLGGFAGSELAVIVYGHLRTKILDSYPMTVSLVGAMVGGAVLLWLKMRLMRKHSVSRWL
jgi:uncharacterized membrane protein YeaQ/YmgE (transglycosylase-associated protein family)